MSVPRRDPEALPVAERESNGGVAEVTPLAEASECVSGGDRLVVAEDEAHTESDVVNVSAWDKDTEPLKVTQADVDSITEALTSVLGVAAFDEDTVPQPLGSLEADTVDNFEELTTELTVAANEAESVPHDVTDNVTVPLSSAVKVADRLEQRLPEDECDADKQCVEECDALVEDDTEGDPELLFDAGVVALADTLNEANAVALGERDPLADADATFDAKGERDSLALGV